MPEDIREWVQDHFDKIWHWYGCGQYAYSACGKPPIPGTPYVYHTIPDWHDLDLDGFVCKRCIEFWNIKNDIR